MSEHSSDDWTVTLVAYANGTLEEDERSEVDAALAGSADLRRELDDIETMRRVLRRDDAPPTIPAAVWDRIETPEGTAAPWPPPVATPSTPAPIGDVVPLRPRRRRRSFVLAGAAAAAAALVVVVAGAVVITRDDDEPSSEDVSAPPPEPEDPAADAPSTQNALNAPAPQALMSTQVAMTSARTARLDVSGTGVARFDGALVGEEGTAEVVLDLTGDGEVNFGDGTPDSSAYRIRIAMEAVSGPESARPDDTEWETIVVDGREYNRENDGPFTEEPPGDDNEEPGLFAAIAVEPDILARLPELAEGEIDDLGVEQLDGVNVRHLRFDVKPSPGDDPDDRYAAEVWIDETGLVHRMRVTVTGPLDLALIDDGEIEVMLDIDLDDFGAPVEISAPS
jgi:hypothetical protein